ncbi:MAG: transposase [Candidatus Hydrogenedentes bacterium]|nr:transposase [Candidatus Hydrogenedentota bacterium]
MSGASRITFISFSRFPPRCRWQRQCNSSRGSSKWAHDTFPREYPKFAWQEGYGAFTIGVSQVERTRAYIQHQREHHARTSFEEEFKAILSKHAISFDEKHILG